MLSAHLSCCARRARISASYRMRLQARFLGRLALVWCALVSGASADCTAGWGVVDTFNDCGCCTGTCFPSGGCPSQQFAYPTQCGAGPGGPCTPCVECAAGYWCGGRCGRFVPCPAGLWGNLRGKGSQAAACTGECDAGYYCLEGSTSPTAAACPAGTYGAVKRLATAACSGVCPLGYFCPEASTSATANPCPKGSYGATTGLGTAACSGLCDAGSYGDVVGLTVSSCSGLCDVGHYCVAGSTSPTQAPCPAGSFGATTGLGTASCSGLCDAGYFGDSPALNASTCSGPCAAGYFCNAGSTNATANACPLNTFSGAGASVCEACPEGSESPVASTVCTVKSATATSTATAASTAAATAVATSAAATAAATAAAATVYSGGALTTGAQAGISVAVIGCVLLAALGAALLWRRRLLAFNKAKRGCVTPVSKDLPPGVSMTFQGHAPPRLSAPQFSAPSSGDSSNDPCGIFI